VAIVGRSTTRLGSANTGCSTSAPNFLDQSNSRTIGKNIFRGLYVTAGKLNFIQSNWEYFMENEQKRINKEQYQKLQHQNPTIRDVCDLGNTVCLNGNVYVCQIGPDMKPDWFFTNELCDELHSEVLGATVITKKLDIQSTTQKPSIAISGIVGEASPKVSTYNLPSVIQNIVGAQCNVAGTAQFSGIGTNILILEFTATGRVGFHYQGVASCTVVLK
jgi:hypothetical protein